MSSSVSVIPPGASARGESQALVRLSAVLSLASLAQYANTSCSDRLYRSSVPMPHNRRQNQPRSGRCQRPLPREIEAKANAAHQGLPSASDTRLAISDSTTREGFEGYRLHRNRAFALVQTSAYWTAIVALALMSKSVSAPQPCKAVIFNPDIHHEAQPSSQWLSHIAVIVKMPQTHTTPLYLNLLGNYSWRSRIPQLTS